MASGSFNLTRTGGTSSYINFTCNWSSTSNGSNYNSSNVYIEIICSKGSGSTADTYGTYNCSITIDGQTYNVGNTSFRVSPGKSINLGSHTFTVGHNNDGTKSTTISCNVGGNVMYGEGSSNITLDPIPRYANINSFTVNKRDENSLNVSWSANVSCDAAWYRIRQSGGSYGNWIGVGGTNFNITGLSANTTYIVQLRVRRADSQLTTDSGDVRQTTYDYPTASSTPNFIIGNPLTLGIYNPLGRTVIVYLKDPLGNESTGKTTTGSSVGDYTESTYTDFLYNGIPDSASGQYSVRVVCSEVSRDITVLGGTYSVTGDEKPVFTDFTYTDINTTTVALSGSTDQNPIIINGYSTVRATISVANKATGSNYANMDKYVLSDGKNSAEAAYSDDTAVTVSLPNFSNEEISLSAVDKRKLSTIVVKDSVFKNYSVPVVDSLVLSRNDGGVGQYGYISFSGEWWNNNFGVQDNAITDVSYWYKEMSQDDTHWVKGNTTITPTTSNNTFSVSNVQISGPSTGGGFDQTKTYDVKITVTDKLGTSTEFKSTMVNAQPGIAIYNNCVSICTSYDTVLGGILQVNHGIVRDGHLLYNNTSGDNGDITLNDTVDDYLYIEVYFKSNDGYYGSQKIYDPNNKTISLITGYRWSDFYLKYKTISIVDDTISTDQYVQVVLPHHGQIELWGDNTIYIVQVIGYK